MKYTYESQEKTLEYLIKNSPHDIEKFKNLYGVETEENIKVQIDLQDILFSGIWTVEEKEQLIKLYEHDIEGFPLIDKCIKKKNYSGVQALLNLGAHISVATIMHIIEYIDNPSERYKFCEIIVNHYKGKKNIQALIESGNLREIPSLCDRYPEYAGYWTNVSPMKHICSTNDLELVKLFLPTVKNINPLFMFAVKSKNIEMVRLFVENGADVNFQDLDFEYVKCRVLFQTPIKTAIDNNDLEMVKFLYQNGANLDFVDKSERMQEVISNLGEDEEEKQTHQYKDEWDKCAYITWAKTPLEYAINLGTVSIINKYIIKDSSADESFEKQFKDRIEIVKYLYENGATFGDGQINYTDLICFAIKSDDFETTKYFFDEALKNNNHLDFIKIIDFIHHPGTFRTSYYFSTHYKNFEEDAIPWFKMCEEYSNKLDKKNYNRNIKLMLEKIFKDFTFNNYQFDRYREVITVFSKALPTEVIKEIPAIFGVSFENLEEILSLGYDINCINNDGNSILMDYICNRHISVETIDKLISLSANPNYQSFNGRNALSCAIIQLTKWDFEKFIYNFNSDTGKLYHNPEEYEKDKKAIVKKMIDLSNQEIIISNSVKQGVYWKMAPGYPQIIYNDILEALSKRGFKVDDDYVTKSITFLDREYSWKYITNPWEYLWNLYSKFSNKSIETHHEFPKIENASKIKYGTEESNRLFTLINEHINRNFATSIDQIKKPNEIVGSYYDITTNKYKERTYLQFAQNRLLIEISRYIGNIDYRQIITLIDSYPIIDTKAIIRNGLLPRAMDLGEINLCKELVKRNVTIVCYDENGHDVTSKLYNPEQIKIFLSLNKEYNPNSECENLLAEIGCNQKVLSMKKKN